MQAVADQTLHMHWPVHYRYPQILVDISRAEPKLVWRLGLDTALGSTLIFQQHSHSSLVATGSVRSFVSPYTRSTSSFLARIE